MSNDLRTRIAAVLHEDGQRPMDTAMRLADAVISELGLRPEWGALDDTNSGICADTKEELSVHPAETLKIRYITEWIELQ